MASHVRNSVKQIDGDSWLIGEKLVLHKKQSAQEWLWRDSNDGCYYSIAEAPTPLPITIPLQSNSYVRLVHDAGDALAVWSFGDAFLKVKLVQDRTAATREHVTLRWLAGRKLSFAIPNALHHTEEADRSHLFVSRVPGRSVADAWRGLSEHEKEHCVVCVGEICEELSAWGSDAMTGVDGAQLPESFLDMFHNPHDFRPETLQENCSQLGMGCDTFVFCHCDLGPYNIMVDRGGSVGVID
ncbi:uncharacterized protein E0L32_005007 [Thyridium curvatum]|uniref:Aminoglycoside phosphotransferase domain-containing protein n=1 Tax=Thyridium curvatum TaxID=1093900 RepID=A0A507BDP6_9PEZI|nr:uncharacterized protein E0L32_005007 [Thyridium curvatum]TPX14898.1 hypothetical protein E0L32_005007 [Thyridium curvatum]